MVASSPGSTSGSSASLPGASRGASAPSSFCSIGSDTVGIVQPPAFSRSARAGSVMISSGSERARPWRISSAVHQPLIRVAIPPAFTIAM
jgi:hypothetical protein